MSETVIKVENLSKQYHIGAREGYKTFRETLVDAAKAPFRAFKKLNPQSAIRNPQSETIWALRDVSFEVKQGEVVGIIGRNGAGKSTLLKILSKITEPTEGRVELRGRVGSLLEVGTGFHPELTGHENVYLYGAILGMDRWEVTRKFDEIVAFAELEKFIDTPVKRYSSGMYMRLAFAVAAHLEPEIFLVDEVLAVGDAAFQKKCLGKMGKFAQEGRTVLFVSHNMQAVRSLCSNGLWLHDGIVKTEGSMGDAVSAYLSQLTETNLIRVWDIEQAPGNEFAKLLKAEVRALGSNKFEIVAGDSFEFEFAFCKLGDTKNQMDVTFHLVDELGTLVFVGSTGQDAKSNRLGKGMFNAICRIPENLMNEGTYTINKILFVQNRGQVLFEYKDVLTFDVRPRAKAFGWMGKKEGVVKPKLDWKVEITES